MSSLFVRWLWGSIVAIGLTGGSLGAAAQQVAKTDAARWYVGAQVGNQLQFYVIDRYGRGLFTNSLGLSAGYVPMPRLAVQAGLRHGRGNAPAEELQGSGQFTNYPETEQITSAWTVPVQLRWSFAKNPHRFRVEGLAGGSVCFFTKRLVPGRPETAPRRVEVTRGTNGYIDVGLGSRLQLFNRLELTTDLLLNANLQRPNNSYYPIAPGYGVALGLNYRL